MIILIPISLFFTCAIMAGFMIIEITRIIKGESLL